MIGPWRWILSVVLLLADLSGATAGQVVTLSSGKSVDILAVAPLILDKSPPALMLKYRTSISVSDRLALRREADEVWMYLFLDADKGGYRLAVIQANETPIGFSIFSGNRTYGFGFEKRDDSWRTMEFKDTDQFRLDAEFVKSLVDRIDLAFNHDNVSALSLYLSNDWTITVSNRENPSEPKTVLRWKFIGQLINPYNDPPRFTRDIIEVAIAKDGLSARVDSRKITDTTIDGRHVRGTEHCTDTFEVQGTSVLWMKSVATVEQPPN
jgi:hypothetical protein